MKKNRCADCDWCGRLFISVNGNLLNECSLESDSKFRLIYDTLEKFYCSDYSERDIKAKIYKR